MSRIIGVVIDGETSWHAANSGPTDYDTLCGLDANDPTIGHTGLVKWQRGQKITCAVCHGIWSGLAALRLRKSDFAKAAITDGVQPTEGGKHG